MEAECVATKRKMRNPGVMRHVHDRWHNLVEIQDMVLKNRMRTSAYQHEQRVSGQDKLRDIAKLHFHPSHIEHQLLTMAAERRIDRSLIRNTFASRKGYGQTACALQIRKNLRKYRGAVRWYAQGDVRKYYQNINHELIRKALCRLFKDKKFVNAFVEPFERFAPDGVGIPLGIRPSQSTGNLMLCAFDHFMLEEVKAADYVRYLDDFMFTGATKGEVKAKWKRAAKYLHDMGFALHEPKIHRVSEGLDMMGYVFYGCRSDMWWRKSDKKLWSMQTGRKTKGKTMGIKFGNCGIKPTERRDSNGTPFIEAPKIGMQMLLGKLVECLRWIGNISTSHGEGRYAVLVRFMGEEYKLIVNSADIKNVLEDMTRNKVTRFSTVFTDKGQMHYGVDFGKTDILEVDSRTVEEVDGKAVFSDTKEEIKFN